MCWRRRLSFLHFFEQRGQRGIEDGLEGECEGKTPVAYSLTELDGNCIALKSHAWTFPGPTPSPSKLPILSKLPVRSASLLQGDLPPSVEAPVASLPAAPAEASSPEHDLDFSEPPRVPLDETGRASPGRYIHSAPLHNVLEEEQEEKFTLINSNYHSLSTYHACNRAVFLLASLCTRTQEPFRDIFFRRYADLYTSFKWPLPMYISQHPYIIPLFGDILDTLTDTNLQCHSLLAFISRSVSLFLANCPSLNSNDFVGTSRQTGDSLLERLLQRQFLPHRCSSPCDLTVQHTYYYHDCSLAYASSRDP